jgi:polysaccharide export outer membrane protein
MRVALNVFCALLAITLLAIPGQAQTDGRASKPQQTINPTPQTDTAIRTSRIVGSKVSNHAVGTPDTGRSADVSLVSSRVAAGSTPSSAIRNDVGNVSTNAAPKNTSQPLWGNAPAKVEETNAGTNRISKSGGTPTPLASLTRIYRVGVGDVLDIRLLDVPTRESTLFTVLAGGVVEYPLIAEPVNVAGMRVEEIGALLTSRIKVIDHPRLSVNVRDHASHNVVVTGLVYNPGSKVLRQEAVPLYVVLAEAVARQGATKATITRNGNSIAVDLADQAAISTLLVSGDMVKVSNGPPAAPQYYYVYGEINAPGEKAFRPGLTLTQSILASGGITKNAGGRVRLTSLTSDAAPSTTEFNVKEILEGRNPDPTLKPGDRLEVIRGRW